MVKSGADRFREIIEARPFEEAIAKAKAGKGGSKPSPKPLPPGLSPQRQAAILAERQRIARARETNRQARELASKLNRLRLASRSERRRFFQNQRELEIALNVQKILERGKTPTPRGRIIFQKVITRISRVPQPKKTIRTISPKVIKPKVSQVKIKTKASRFERTKKTLTRAFDVISGGSVTESRLNKRQAEINKDTEKFNKQFGEGELSESEFLKAQAESLELNSKQKKIDTEKEELEKSLRRKAGKVIGTVEIEIKLDPKSAKNQRKRIPGLQKQVDKVDKKLINLEGKTSIPSKLKRIQLNFKRGNLESRIDQIERGIAEVKQGEFPIIPATRIPKGITKVKFLGSQKVSKTGKITTDIIFRTSKGNIGIAKGVAVQKGSKGQSIVFGRFAEKGVKFPSKRVKLGKPRSFVGVEEIVSKPTTLKIKETIDILRRKKKVGTISVIKNNLQILIQRGVGKTAVVKGKKFFRPTIRFPSGIVKAKKVKGISVNDFASLSSIFTKEQLSLIIGKSISRLGAKSQFIGLIKGSSKLSKGVKFTFKQKQQFQKALQKVISASSSAVAQAEQIQVGSVSKVASLATASKIISTKPISKAIISTRPTAKITTITRPTLKLGTSNLSVIKTKITRLSRAKQKPLIKGLSQIKVLQKVLQKQNQKLRTLQKAKQKAKQTQKVEQVQTQLQKQKLRLKTIQRQVQETVKRINPKLTISGIPRLIIPLIIFPSDKRPRIKKKLKKPVQVFNVFGKVKGKFIKLNRVPLTKQDALSKGTFAIDRTTARTLEIRSVGKAKIVGKLLKGERGYFSRNRNKLRAFKIRRGKRIKLKQKFIEKRKFGIDTRGEKRGLKLRRLITQQRRPKRIITPARRKQLLQSLRKARRVRAKKSGKGGKRK